jgi:hypothetical protein
MNSMNFVRACNSAFATALIVVYLFFSASSFVNAASLEFDGSSPQVTNSMAAAAPCDSCPCSDDHGSDCCDSTFCSCSCHAPLSHGLQLSYAPEISIQSFREPSWPLLQVYRSIFVPPQNYV